MHMYIQTSIKKSFRDLLINKRINHLMQGLGFNPQTDFSLRSFKPWILLHQFSTQTLTRLK